MGPSMGLKYSPLQLKAQKIVFLSLVLAAGVNISSCSSFSVSCLFFGKGGGASFSKPVDDVYKGDVSWGIKKCLLGKEDAFLCMAYISPWNLGRCWQRAGTLVATSG